MSTKIKSVQRDLRFVPWIGGAVLLYVLWRVSQMVCFLWCSP